MRIDRNGDGDTADSGEGVFVNGDPVEIAGKDYRVKNYTQGVEFVYAGENKVELVNYRTSFPGTADQRLARMGYSNSYSSEQLSLVASNIHWLAGTKKEFGSGEDNLVSTVAVDSVNEEVYMPYRFNLRWSR